MAEEKDVGTVKYETRGRIGIATLSRPDKLNAFNREMLAELTAVLDEVEGDGNVRVLIIRGEGEKAFAAGADLNLLITLNGKDARDISTFAQRIMTKIEALPIPVIAAVQGVAVGGGLELPLACDLILASEGSRLGLVETNLGILPGWGGCIRLPRRVGLGRAKEMIFSGRLVQAGEALSMGLVDAVFSDDGFEDSIMEYAKMLSRKSPVSMTLAKSAILRGMDASLEAGLALEREAFAYCFSMPDAREGISAFLEKRPPRFEDDDFAKSHHRAR
ncbi:MAG: enoyl-CoA hydratase/isomerase family protein [Deltaproteobacteria bacterium]|nr:enoyl-CoA hydratase/isomerase family protein [Deltaproteobacteria bacterium]